MILEYYQIIKARLQEITQLKEVDWYYAQEEQAEENTLFVDCGAYIEFEAIDWATMGTGIQQATLGFNIHVVSESMYDNDQRVLDPTTNHLGLNALVYQKLHKYGAWLSSLPAFAALANTGNDKRVVNEIVRTSTTPDHRLSNLMVTVQRFQSTVLDVSATPAYIQTLINNLNITASYDN
jgi:hypothetical protein